jgi:hypothetical protein
MCVAPQEKCHPRRSLRFSSGTAMVIGRWSSRQSSLTPWCGLLLNGVTLINRIIMKMFQWVFRETHYSSYSSSSSPWTQSQFRSMGLKNTDSNSARHCRSRALFFSKYRTIALRILLSKASSVASKCTKGIRVAVCRWYVEELEILLHTVLAF